MSSSFGFSTFCLFYCNICCCRDEIKMNLICLCFWDKERCRMNTWSSDVSLNVKLYPRKKYSDITQQESHTTVWSMHRGLDPVSAGCWFVFLRAGSPSHLKLPLLVILIKYFYTITLIVHHEAFSPQVVNKTHGWAIQTTFFSLLPLLLPVTPEFPRLWINEVLSYLKRDQTAL